MKELIKNIFLLHRLTHVQLYNPFASYSATWHPVTICPTCPYTHPRTQFTHINTSTYTSTCVKKFHMSIHTKVHNYIHIQIHIHIHNHTWPHTSHRQIHVCATIVLILLLPLLTHPPWSQLVVSLMQIVGFCFRSICFSIISIIIYI